MSDADDVKAQATNMLVDKITAIAVDKIIFLFIVIFDLYVYKNTQKS